MNPVSLVLAIGAVITLLGGIAQAIIAGIDLHTKFVGTQKKKRWGVVILICVALTPIFGYASYAYSNASMPPPAPSSPTPGSTTTQSPSTAASSSPTASTPATPATLANGSGQVVKNLTLSCTQQCPSESVHVTINSVQVDTANGRMIWDTTLRDITASNKGFSIVTYDLEASGSTTPVAAVLSQTQFTGNQNNMQAIFPFLPVPNTPYTLTMVVNWAYNTSNNITFDPIKITFSSNGTPTAVEPQPLATVATSLITKTPILTCNQCSTDPVHVIINSIQIDNANGRMIWDTTLKDITASNKGFSIVKYDLEANGSTTPVSAVLSQTQFTGNQATMQAIFAFSPSLNTPYTLSMIVNWAYNTSNNITFDPVNVTF